ncbi:MAG: D-sedoheptulose-7-phosphate isomerase [Planctomycetota bacterium]|jgi:D-sedoheptulose 7-phosphate isomerase
MTEPDATLRGRLGGTRAALDALEGQLDVVAGMAVGLARSLASGGTVYTAGNGGSASQAMHLSEELIGRYRGDRPALRAVCLNADPTALTCIANDFGYANVFSRQGEALFGAGDVFIGFTTSGNSANLVAAFETARARGTSTYGLLGGDGGACRDLCEQAIVIPGTDSAHAQEAHLVVLHMLCEHLES